MGIPTSVEELGPGDHACLTFSDQEERLDIVTAFVRVGLEQGQKILCLTDTLPPERLSAEFGDRGMQVAGPLRYGQLNLRTSDEAWLVGGGFTATRMIDDVGEEVDRARREGYAGLRLAADMGWAVRPVAGVEQLVVFETSVSELFGDDLLTAICQYDREQFDPVTLASAATAHGCTVAATVYFEDPVVRVCRQHSPPGIRVAGELDYNRVAALSHALAEAVRLDKHVHVNMAQLHFIDVAAAGAVVKTALGMGPGRRITVVCNALVRKVLNLVGAADVPHLRVVVAHGEP
jgi:anti-anti-sigma regulatory factor